MTVAVDEAGNFYEVDDPPNTVAEERLLEVDEFLTPWGLYLLGGFLQEPDTDYWVKK